MHADVIEHLGHHHIRQEVRTFSTLDVNTIGDTSSLLGDLLEGLLGLLADMTDIVRRDRDALLLQQLHLALVVCLGDGRVQGVPEIIFRTGSLRFDILLCVRSSITDQQDLSNLSLGCLLVDIPKTNLDSFITPTTIVVNGVMYSSRRIGSDSHVEG